MKIDKKYAIRKLAVEVVSVSIGFFVANASNLLDIPETNKIGISEVKAAEKGHLDSEPWTTVRYQEGMEITKDPGDKYNYFTDYKAKYVFKYQYFNEDGSITYKYFKTFTETGANGEPVITYFPQQANDELPKLSELSSEISGDKTRDYGDNEEVGTSSESPDVLYSVNYTSVEPTLSETGETIPSTEKPKPDWEHSSFYGKPILYKGDKDRLTLEDIRVNFKFFHVGLKTEINKEKVADRKVIYRKNSSLKENETNVVQEGRDKIKITTIEYDFKNQKLTNEEYKNKIEVNQDIPTVENGEVKRTITETFEEAIDKIIEKGTPVDKEDITSIPSPIRYEKDDTREKGLPDIKKEGTPGKIVVPITYNVKEDTGDIVENRGEPVRTEPIETVIKVAAKDKVVYSKDGNDIVKTTTIYEVNPKTGEITSTDKVEIFKKDGLKPTEVVEKIPSPIRYEKDDSREKGQENIIIKGKDGSKTTRTTYTVNPETGEVIPNTEKPVIVEPTETVIKVPAKDKVVYSKDGNDIVKTTTIYEVNPRTGEITSTDKVEVFKKDGLKTTEVVEKIPSPIRYEKDDTREKGQENIVIKGKDGTKTTRTTYTVNPETGEVIPNTEKPVIVEPTETVIKVPVKDKVEIINKKDGKTYRRTTTYEVNKKTGEITETVKEELIADKGEPLVFDNLTELKVGIIKDTDGNVLKVIKIEETPEPIDGYVNTGKVEMDSDGSKVYIYKKTIENSKGTEKPPVVENKDFVGGVNPIDSPIREALPELKVAIIKDSEGNILDVIKLEETPKEIKGYKNTGKTEIDKNGYKIYIYEKIKENKKPVVEDKKVNLKENNKEVIKKKEELPKTSATMLAPFGLLTGLALRKKKK